VKSHPFAELLAGKEGGRLPLADHVPADRLFVYFAKPSAVFPLLDHGGEFLFRTGGLFSKSAVDDDLKRRYLRRLGLAEGQARRLLASGEVTELALVTPDLFFLDGTDITVLMRFKGEGVAEQVRRAARAPHRERRAVAQDPAQQYDRLPYRGDGDPRRQARPGGARIHAAAVHVERHALQHGGAGRSREEDQEEETQQGGARARLAGVQEVEDDVAHVRRGDGRAQLHRLDFEPPVE